MVVKRIERVAMGAATALVAGSMLFSQCSAVLRFLEVDEWEDVYLDIPGAFVGSNDDIIFIDLPGLEITFDDDENELDIDIF